MEQQPTKQNAGPGDAERKLEDQKLQDRMRDIRLKLMVLSGKGGVGKSTVAANLALYLAAAGKNVGLLDIDIHGPSIPKLLGLEGLQPRVGQDIFPIRVRDNLKVMSIGFLLSGTDQPVIWRGPLKFHAIRQFLKDVAWGYLDYLIVDSPPGTGDEPLAAAQLIGSPAGAVIVTTPQDLAISDVRKCISFCHSLSIPIVGIVENMSGFVCPKCGLRIDLFKSGGGKALAAETMVPFLGSVPLDPEIVTSGDSGKPFSLDRSQSETVKAFENVVRKIMAVSS
ncbi:MAG TPA: Mrp/NBP35 family ATP-binding protein [archaeon]|nr:Mrp/NBP35 family ATP-binding protein [archaeon]